MGTRRWDWGAWRWGHRVEGMGTRKWDWGLWGHRMEGTGLWAQGQRGRDGDKEVGLGGVGMGIQSGGDGVVGTGGQRDKGTGRETRWDWGGWGHRVEGTGLWAQGGRDGDKEVGLGAMGKGMVMVMEGMELWAQGDKGTGMGTRRWDWGLWGHRVEGMGLWAQGQRGRDGDEVGFGGDGDGNGGDGVVGTGGQGDRDGEETKVGNEGTDVKGRGHGHRDGGGTQGHLGAPLLGGGALWVPHVPTVPAVL